MTNRCKSLVLSLIMVAGCLPLAAQTYTLQAFNVPYAPPKSNTYALGINNRGAVVGYIGYTDPMSGAHVARGFKRDANGVFEYPIDDPNTTPPNLYTVAIGINDSGVIGGFYVGPNHNNRGSGFLRNKGVFTDYFLNPPGGYTTILGINNKGDFVGQFPGVQGKGQHGFVSVNGVVTQIDYPGAKDTMPSGIAADGSIVGVADGGHTSWGFVRGPAGHFKAIQLPGVLNTATSGINSAAHKIVGFYSDVRGNHGFVYDYITDVITTVDWPDPNTLYTSVSGINSQGVIVGSAYIKDPQNLQTYWFSFIGTPQ